MVFVFAAITRLVAARPWGLLYRFAALVVLLGAFPLLCWFMAVTSPGSGWFFGLIALIVTVTSLFGALMGWIWLSLSR